MNDNDDIALSFQTPEEHSKLYFRWFSTPVTIVTFLLWFFPFAFAFSRIRRK